MSKAKAKLTSRPPSGKQTGNKRLFLHLTVLQQGAPQLTACVPLGGLFSRRVRFGRARKAELSVPLAHLPDALRVFRVGRGKVSAFIDPRFDGFLNDGSRFGTVREFIAPRGSLRDLATVLEPLEVKLAQGARGTLRFADYEILFRIDGRVDAPRLAARIQGAGRAPLALPEANDAVERYAALIAALAVGLVFVPLVGWLLKAPKEDLAGVGNLPHGYASQIIHPDHYKALPFVFRERMDEEPAARLAHEWVNALHARWRAAEEGRVAPSEIGLLADYPAGSIGVFDVEAVERRARAAYGTFHSDTERAKDERFFKVMKGYPRVMTSTSGGTRGSFFVRQVSRIQRVRTTLASIESQALAEQEFLVDFYTSQGVEMKKPFDEPRKETITGPVPDAEFGKEKAWYAASEAAAADARQSNVRARLVAWADQGARGRVGAVWLGEDGALAPAFLAGRLVMPQTGADNLLENARYAAEIKALPPPPKPKSVINMLDVDLLVYAKREELRACYEAALRRDKAVGGTVEWLVELDTGGVLRGLKVARSDTQDREFLFCLKERVKGWSFPAPKGGDIAFRYPFRFRRTPSSSKDP